MAERKIVATRVSQQVVLIDTSGTILQLSLDEATMLQQDLSRVLFGEVDNAEATG